VSFKSVISINIIANIIYVVRWPALRLRLFVCLNLKLNVVFMFIYLQSK